MKKYSVRPGIVLLSVGEEHMLVADLEAREHVAYLQQLNDRGAFYWRLLEKQLSFSEIVNLGSKTYNSSQAETFMDFRYFIQRLAQKGYLIEKGE